MSGNKIITSLGLLAGAAVLSAPLAQASPNTWAATCEYQFGDRHGTSAGTGVSDADAVSDAKANAPRGSQILGCDYRLVMSYRRR